MTNISSSLSGNSLYSTSLSRLDINGDGAVSGDELAVEEKASGTPRSQDPTVKNENAASGLSSQVAGGIVNMMLTAAENGAVGTDGRFAEDDDTVSLFDVLEEMKQVIAAYSAHTSGSEGEPG
ncbi:hypothetical protein [Rhizobium arsenicireducens]